MAQANIKAVITAEDRASSVVSGFGSSVKGMALAVTAGALAAQALSKAIGMVKDSVDGAIKRVDILNNFPRVMQNLGFDSREAAVEIKRLENGVKGLPTSLDTIASAMQNIAPSSKSMAYATDLSLALNNALLAGGQSMDIQSTAMQQFSQAISKGKPDMVEWRSLAVAMPGQLDQISQSLGYGRGEWQKMAADVSDGVLPFEKVKDAIINLNKEGINGLPNLADQAKAATGGIQTAMANMNTAITRGVANIIQTIGADNISNALVSVGNVFEGALKGMKSALITLQPVIKIVFDFLAEKTGVVIGGMQRAFEYLKPAIMELWTAISTNLWPAIQNLYTAIEPLLPVIGTVLVGALYAAIKVLTIMVNYWSWLYNGVAAFVNFIKGDAVTGITGAFQWIQDKFTYLKDHFFSIIGTIIGFFATLPFKLPVYMVMAMVAIINYLKGINWTNVFASIGQAHLNIWNSVKNKVSEVYNWMRNIDWGGVVRGLFNSVNTAIVRMIEGAINGALAGLPGAPKIRLNYKKFANGVENFGGGMAIVGERGPEAVYLPQGSSVKNATETSKMSGSTVINISPQIGVFTGSNQEMRKLSMEIVTALRDVANSKNMTIGELIG